ncbi:transposase [Amycolatopsis acidiphila]|uniref:transposase n=1 Tax=Amycolatopsis acidiphila TaxID=715473 RepID=UPI001C963DDF|nr:transposase [Amycolatopsis acidiphila]
MKALFEVVAGPLAQPRTPGVCVAGLRTVAFDGLNSLKVPDTDRNRCRLGRIRYRMGFAGYPTLRLMTPAETGTRALLGAVIGQASERDETGLARRLLPKLGPGMLLLVDRAFDATGFFTEVAATGAMLLARAKSTRNPPVLRHLPDGSYLSTPDGLGVRIIEAELAVTGADGSRVGDPYRLITTLTDHARYPATALIRLYHERWEIETAYLAPRHTLLDGHVLRSGDRPGLEQEIWALLTVYQLLRTAMVTAIESQPGIDPDRASFTTALETARDQLTAAAGVCPDPCADSLGALGRAVLATLLPPRRSRYSARKVKCSTSRYLNRDDDRPATATTITAIDIVTHTPALTTPPPRPARPRDRTKPRPTTRHARVIALMTTDPDRHWNATELATRPNIPSHNLLTQLAEWARPKPLTRTSTGYYTPNPQPPSTTPPNPQLRGITARRTSSTLDPACPPPGTLRIGVRERGWARAFLAAVAGSPWWGGWALSGSPQVAIGGWLGAAASASGSRLPLPRRRRGVAGHCRVRRW